MFFASTTPPTLPMRADETVQPLSVLLDIGIAILILLFVVMYFKVKDSVK